MAMTTNGTRPWRALVFGDYFPTGFGRITREVAQHLKNIGYQVMGADLHYDGILPHPLPIEGVHICGLAGRDMGLAYAGHARTIANICQVVRPDLIVSIQDFPYHQQLRTTPIDWSTTAHVVITPVDGKPVNPDWLDVVKQVDGFMTISAFGVEAFSETGYRVALCPPGVDAGEFHRYPDAQRGALRDKMGLSREAFIVGVMAMNQGRKDFGGMIRAFAEAYRDVPEAVLYLDTDRVSMAGWDIPKQLCKPHGLDIARVRFRDDAIRAGLNALNDRYNLLDLHMVIAHREGYGLPHGEAMATGCPSVSMDWCSGREIIGDNERGWLVPGTPFRLGTWGGAWDYGVDHAALVAALREAYDNPAERRARGERGRVWATTERTWAAAMQNVDQVIAAVMRKRGDDMRKKDGLPPVPPMPAVQSIAPAGITQIVVNGPVHVNGNNAQQIAQGLQVAALPQNLILQPGLVDLTEARAIVESDDDEA